MITIPTTELIGCLTDVLPQISDEKGALAGVKVAWDGDSLHFTTYDVYSGATVTWTPGEGAEGTIDESGESESEDIAWGGDDAAWATWIWLPQAKEILKLFKLPAKLWRFPVTLKCSLSGDRLTVERTDSPKGERLLSIPGQPDQLKHVPDMGFMASAQREITDRPGARFHASRLGAFGGVRPHGAMQLTFGTVNDPVGVQIGSRVTGFLYFADAKDVRPYSFLRDGSGLATRG